MSRLRLPFSPPNSDGAHNALIQSRLRQSAGAAALLLDETASASGHFARNIEFELVVAAHLVNGGAALLQLDLSDVTVSWHGATVLVECKRLQSQAGVEAALSKAKLSCALRTTSRRVSTLSVSLHSI